LADAGHQPGAMTNGHGDAVGFFQRLDGEAVFERRGNRLLRVDVLARLRHLARDGKMLLVRDRQDDALNVRVAQHALQVGRRPHAHLAGEALALLLGTAEAADDFDLVGRLDSAGEHLGPAPQSDNANLDRALAHGDFPLFWRSYQYRNTVLRLEMRSKSPCWTPPARLSGEPRRRCAIRSWTMSGRRSFPAASRPGRG